MSRAQMSNEHATRIPRRRSLLPDGRLEPDGGKNKDTCYEGHPNWDEVGPPLTALYLSIMKVDCCRDELTGKIGWQLPNAPVILRQNMPCYQRHCMFALGADAKELGVRSRDFGPRTSGF